jgi:large subunit ribosomal protein L22
MSRSKNARPALGEMVSMARTRFTRVPARKTRYVADLIRGLTVEEANAQLAVIHRPSAAPIVAKTLKSAVANVKDKDYEGDVDELILGEVLVDDGPILKRYRPRAMGRATPIRKRMSHLTIKLYESGE